jgi:hypothetical protein
MRRVWLTGSEREHGDSVLPELEEGLELTLAMGSPPPPVTLTSHAR